VGYNFGMTVDNLAFVLRMAIVATAWMLVWIYMKPRTQAHRIARAALLVLVLLFLLAILRSAGV